LHLSARTKQMQMPGVTPSINRGKIKIAGVWIRSWEASTAQPREQLLKLFERHAKSPRRFVARHVSGFNMKPPSHNT